jgi:LysR family transcriptional regulator for bpeEF and oprC
MDRFQAIRAFREVARQGGFAAAARALHCSTPTVSRLLAELEADLGVRLLTRSTRSVGLTEEGERFLRRGVALVDELDAVTAEIRERKTEPRGHLRISSVVAFGQEMVAPALTGFVERYPKVTVELDISNRKVDLVQEHFDIAIRIGGADGLEASALKARRIFSQKLIFVATPEYVAAHGQPTDLDDLARHRVVKQISGTWGRVNEFRRDGAAIAYSLPESFVVNSPNAARNAVLTGRAMGLIADYLVAELIADGRLRRLLPGYETPDQPIYAVFVHRNYMPAKVRAFIDYMVEAFSERSPA